MYMKHEIRLDFQSIYDNGQINRVILGSFLKLFVDLIHFHKYNERLNIRHRYIWVILDFSFLNYHFPVCDKQFSLHL